MFCHLHHWHELATVITPSHHFLEETRRSSPASEDWEGRGMLGKCGRNTRDGIQPLIPVPVSATEPNLPGKALPTPPMVKRRHGKGQVPRPRQKGAPGAGINTPARLPGDPIRAALGSLRTAH